MKRNAADAIVVEFMQDFARLTGLAPGGTQRRYLWTDAFAVCNFVALFRLTKNETFRDLALQLVDQVHHSLGRHRSDDPRTGWISGFDEQEGELHPTKGGLRIGKKLNERKPGEPPDDSLEWDQDGQYYHYLTKWMHALNCVGRVTGNPTFIRWALELAQTAHKRFTYVSSPGGRKKMYWKMSIDLTHPLVFSMGQHDPLDGLVTYSELQAAVKKDFGQFSLPELSIEIADMFAICRGESWVTDDPLGIGGLIFDASRIAQLIIRGGSGYTGLLETVVSAALSGLEAFFVDNPLRLPAEYRLAFRELGLSIGLKGAGKLHSRIKENPGLFGGALNREIEALMRYVPLGETIERFWMDEKNTATDSWTGHREINMVMLATSLAPEEFLCI